MKMLWLAKHGRHILKLEKVQDRIFLISADEMFTKRVTTEARIVISIYFGCWQRFITTYQIKIE